MEINTLLDETTGNLLAIGPQSGNPMAGLPNNVIELSSEEEFDEDNPEWGKWNCNQIRTKGKRKKQGQTQGHETKRKATEEKEQKTKKLKTGDELRQKIEQVQLPDMDEEGNVPVYDDCDEIRKKINYFLGEKTVTKAAFLRALGDVNSNSLRSFMNLKRGAGSGAANVVYRTAYVFFEKKRILEDGKKTKKRLENEAKQGRKGFPLHHDNGMRWVYVGKDERILSVGLTGMHVAA